MSALVEAGKVGVNSPIFRSYQSSAPKWLLTNGTRYRRAQHMRNTGYLSSIQQCDEIVAGLLVEQMRWEGVNTFHKWNEEWGKSKGAERTQ